MKYCFSLLLLHCTVLHCTVLVGMDLRAAQHRHILYVHTNCADATGLKYNIAEIF